MTARKFTQLPNPAAPQPYTWRGDCQTPINRWQLPIANGLKGPAITLLDSGLFKGLNLFRFGLRHNAKAPSALRIAALGHPIHKTAGLWLLLHATPCYLTRDCPNCDKHQVVFTYYHPPAMS